MTVWVEYLTPAVERGEEHRACGFYAEAAAFLRQLGKRGWELTDDCRLVLRLIMDGLSPLHGATDVVARLHGAWEAAYHGLITAALHITPRGFTALQRASDR